MGEERNPASNKAWPQLHASAYYYHFGAGPTIIHLAIKKRAPIPQKAQKKHVYIYIYSIYIYK